MEQLEKAYEKLFNNCRTVRDKNDFKVRFSSIVEKMYTTSFNFQNEVNSTLPYDEAKALWELLGIKDVNTSNKNKLTDFIDGINDRLNTLEVVELVTAYYPTLEDLQSICDWFEINKQKKVILDIKVNQDIIGGIILKYQGKSTDLSLRKSLQERIDKLENKIETT